MRNLILTLLLTLILGSLLGCGGRTERLAEGQVVTKAPELLGPAERYYAEVRGISSSAVDSVRVTGIAVRPDPNLVVDPLLLTLSNVNYRLRPFRIVNVGEATFSGRVSQAAMNQYIRQSHIVPGSSIGNIQVQLERNLVRVTAVFPVYGVDIPIATTGHIRMDEGVRINYELDSLKVIGVGVPANIGNLLLARVNPLVDLSGLRFTPRINKVVVEPGGILFDGKAFLRDLTLAPRK